MHRNGTALAALTLLAAAAASPASASPRGLLPQQSISLHAISGDGASDGTASLTVTKENNGFRLRGTVESLSGCVELKAVFPVKSLCSA